MPVRSEKPFWYVNTNIIRVGRNRINALYMNVYLVIFLPKIPYTNRIYMVLANPKHNLVHEAYCSALDESEQLLTSWFWYVKVGCIHRPACTHAMEHSL
jgi:hypothetical protein